MDGTTAPGEASALPPSKKRERSEMTGLSAAGSSAGNSPAGMLSGPLPKRSRRDSSSTSSVDAQHHASPASDSASPASAPGSQAFELKERQKIARRIDGLLTIDTHGIFIMPVTDDFAPEYSKVIRQPMCILELKSKLKEKMYITADEFVKDVRLMLDNARAYNEPGSFVYNEADRVQRDYDSRYKEDSIYHVITAGYIPRRPRKLLSMVDEDDQELPPQPTEEALFPAVPAAPLSGGRARASGRIAALAAAVKKEESPSPAAVGTAKSTERAGARSVSPTGHGTPAEASPHQQQPAANIVPVLHRILDELTAFDMSDSIRLFPVADSDKADLTSIRQRVDSGAYLPSSMDTFIADIQQMYAALLASCRMNTKEYRKCKLSMERLQQILREPDASTGSETTGGEAGSRTPSISNSRGDTTSVSAVTFPVSAETDMLKVVEQLKKIDKELIFYYPVTADIAPNYDEYVKEPMDFQTLESRIKGRQIPSRMEFDRLLALTFENAMAYNLPGSYIYNLAAKMLFKSRELSARVFGKPVGAAMPPSSASKAASAAGAGSLLSSMDVEGSPGAGAALAASGPAATRTPGTTEKKARDKSKDLRKAAATFSAAAGGGAVGAAGSSSGVGAATGAGAGGLYSSSAVGAFLGVLPSSHLLLQPAAASASAAAAAAAASLVPLPPPPPPPKVSAVHLMKEAGVLGRNIYERPKRIRDVLLLMVEKFIAEDNFGIFTDPVDVTVYPQYARLVMNRVCLKDMKTFVEGGKYDRDGSLEMFREDFSLLCKNMLKVGQEGSLVLAETARFQTCGLHLIDTIARRIVHVRPCAEPVSTGTGGSLPTPAHFRPPVSGVVTSMYDCGFVYTGRDQRRQQTLAKKQAGEKLVAEFREVVLPQLQDRLQEMRRLMQPAAAKKAHFSPLEVLQLFKADEGHVDLIDSQSLLDTIGYLIKRVRVMQLSPAAGSRSGSRGTVLGTGQEPGVGTATPDILSDAHLLHRFLVRAVLRVDQPRHRLVPRIASAAYFPFQTRPFLDPVLTDCHIAETVAFIRTPSTGLVAGAVGAAAAAAGKKTAS